MTPKIDVRRVLEVFLPHSTALTEKQVVQHLLARYPPAMSDDPKVIFEAASQEVHRKLEVCTQAHLLTESRGYDLDAACEVTRYTITPSGCNFISHR